MIALLLLLALQIAPTAAASPAPLATPAPVVAPATTPGPAPVATPEAQPTTADTLAGLEETSRASCGQTGILYSGYAELCDSLRKQIAQYRRKVDREAELAAKASAKH